MPAGLFFWSIFSIGWVERVVSQRKEIAMAEKLLHALPLIAYAMLAIYYGFYLLKH